MLFFVCSTLLTAKSGTGILIHINVFIFQRSKNEFDLHAVYHSTSSLNLNCVCYFFVCSTLLTAKSGTDILIHINVFIFQKPKNEFDLHAVYHSTSSLNLNCVCYFLFVPLFARVELASLFILMKKTEK